MECYTSKEFGLWHKLKRKTENPWLLSDHLSLQRSRAKLYSYLSSGVLQITEKDRNVTPLPCVVTAIPCKMEVQVNNEHQQIDNQRTNNRETTLARIKGVSVLEQLLKPRKAMTGKSISFKLPNSPLRCTKCPVTEEKSARSLKSPEKTKVKCLYSQKSPQESYSCRQFCNPLWPAPKIIHQNPRARVIEPAWIRYGTERLSPLDFKDQRKPEVESLSLIGVHCLKPPVKYVPLLPEVGKSKTELHIYMPNGLLTGDNADSESSDDGFEEDVTNELHSRPADLCVVKDFQQKMYLKELNTKSDLHVGNMANYIVEKDEKKNPGGWKSGADLTPISAIKCPKLPD
ncbi:uncharacterized protein LOC103187086 [Callorhinchus milii]|uniref:uncharacterized protein LOC103187086 n=1 Tax=Callorhinchus milii TaxID=7868 RepID=UPI001C3FC957|nr:uncharacterized protein LOC103187086 [Callorhinchus milii]